MIFNYLHQTHPVVVHMPGNNSMVHPISKLALSLPSHPMHDLKDLTIITWNNLESVSILEQSLKLWGLPYIVLGKGIKKWKNAYKIPLTCNALCKIKTPYVMGLDAFDVVLFGDIQIAKEKFLQRGCKMLFNATPIGNLNCLQGIRFSKNLYPEDSARYINSGVWIGKTEFCLSVYLEARKVLKSVDSSSLCASDDQTHLSTLFPVRYPDMQLDVKCEVFQLIIPWRHNDVHIPSLTLL